MKTMTQLAKEEIAARKAAKAVEKAAQEAAREEAKAKRQAEMTAREVAAAKRIKSIQDARNVFKPKLSLRQEMAARSAKELLAKQGY